jgi:UDP-glucose 6-dehydrogenase
MVEHKENDLNEYFKYQEDDKSFTIKEILCIGAGYVGTLSMTIFAYQYPGIKINIFDKNEQLIEKWRKAKLDSLPIIEPKFRKYYEQVYKRNLFFLSELNSNLEEFDLIFICVNTPSSSCYKISLKESLNGLSQLSNDINRGIQISTDNV